MFLGRWIHLLLLSCLLISLFSFHFVCHICIVPLFLLYLCWKISVHLLPSFKLFISLFHCLPHSTHYAYITCISDCISLYHNDVAFLSTYRHLCCITDISLAFVVLWKSDRMFIILAWIVPGILFLFLHKVLVYSAEWRWKFCKLYIVTICHCRFGSLICPLLMNWAYGT
jgi:hypothetical protein